MSNLVPATRTFHGHNMTVATVNGQPWLQANDLTGPTGNTKRAIQKMVATLPESERCELEVRTSGGTQTATYMPTGKVMSTEELAERAMAEAESGLRGWQRRYQFLANFPKFQTRFGSVVKAIEALKP